MNLRSQLTPKTTPAQSQAKNLQPIKQVISMPMLKACTVTFLTTFSICGTASRPAVFLLDRVFFLRYNSFQERMIKHGGSVLVPWREWPSSWNVNARSVKKFHQSQRIVKDENGTGQCVCTQQHLMCFQGCPA